MQYNYKNINVNVSNLNPDHVQDLGETYMTISSDLVAELVENSCTFFEFFLPYQEPELYDELDQDVDNIVDHYKNLDGPVEVYMPDAIIAVYEYALDNEHRDFTFDIVTENISWVIHDIQHAVHDTAGCTISVYSDIEKQRILNSLEITQEQFPEEMPGFDFLEKLEDSFRSRFNENLDLEKFKYQEEYI